MRRAEAFVAFVFLVFLVVLRLPGVHGPAGRASSAPLPEQREEGDGRLVERLEGTTVGLRESSDCECQLLVEECSRLGCLIGHWLRTSRR